MPGMGPPPKAANQRARRNATVGMTALPAEGRTGPTPEWPLPPDIRVEAALTVAEAAVSELLTKIGDLTDRRKLASLNTKLGRAQEQVALLRSRLRLQHSAEMDLWRELWSTPQAAQWERLRWSREVASYVRYRIAGEMGDLECAKEARQWSDRLGLSPLAMLRLRWQIVSDEVAERRGFRPEPVAAPKSGSGDDPFAALRAV